MKVEHIAWTVADPQALAAWYCRHLGMRILRKSEGPAHTHLLADKAGRVVLELYHNPKVHPPDYRTMDPLLIHLAFEVDDVAADRARLLANGATAVGDIDQPSSGDCIAMLRDPWGFPIQLVNRAHPLTIAP